MRTTLSNGLGLVIDENHTAPVVAFQVWVGAGSADEWPDEHGIAHLHEHMLFKGTARRAPGEIARTIEGAGGTINAWTSFDQTVFHCVVASRFWQSGLDVLADAVTSAAFDPGELEREIEVVCEEIKRSLDSPTRRLSRALFAAAFEKHPYGRPVIGTTESVRSFSRERILRFYRRWYAPANCVLIACGDVNREDVVREAERLFAWPVSPGVPALAAPLSFLPAAERVREPVRTRPRVSVQEANVREGLVSLGFPAPHQNHPDVAALDALALVLAHGESSRLCRALQRERLLCSDVQASSYTPRDPGLFVVSLSLQPTQVKHAVEETLRQLHRLRSEEIGEDELERAGRILEADAVYQRETVQGQARKLGFWESGGGGLAGEERYFARVAALTPAELLAVAQRHLDPNQLVLASVMPPDARARHGVGEELLTELARTAAGSLSITLPPRPQEAPRAARPVPRVSGKSTVGPLERIELPGGGVLLVKVERSVPLLALRAAWNGGLRAEPEALGGAHLLLSRIVSKGTRRRGAEQLSNDVERMGGSLSGSAGRNSFGLHVEALARAHDEAVELFAEALCEPAFEPDEVDRERTLQREDLRARDDNPGGVAFRLFETTLWTRHPYRLDVLGTEDSLAALDATKLEALRKERYVPAGAVIAAVGDLDPERIRQTLAERLAQSAERARLVPPPEPTPEPLVERPRVAVRTLAKAQAHLVLGFPGVRLQDDARFPLSVLASILSGQGGRLFVELRDKQSLAYSISAFSMEGCDPGSFAVHIACGPEKIALALAGIRAELSRCRETLVGAAELDKAKAHLIGAQAIGLQRGSARAAIFAFDECYGLGARASERVPEQLGAVTAADVRAVAERFLDPRREVIALVCPEQTAPRELQEAAAREERA